MTVHYEYFPEEAIALQKELHNHPALTKILREDMSLNERLGHIAAYCNVEVDGMFDDADLKELFTLLVHRLKNKSIILL